MKLCRSSCGKTASFALLAFSIAMATLLHCRVRWILTCVGHPLLTWVTWHHFTRQRYTYSLISPYVTLCSLLVLFSYITPIHLFSLTAFSLCFSLFSPLSPLSLLVSLRQIRFLMCSRCINLSWFCSCVFFLFFCDTTVYFRVYVSSCQNIGVDVDVPMLALHCSNTLTCVA